MMRKITSFCVCLLVIIGTSNAAEFNYADALDKTFMFFEAQRSGKLPANQRVKWRGDSGLKDGFQQGVNMVGGYYDAGDNVKFGLPMAYSVTMLAWATIDFKKEITSHNQMGQTLWAIRWGTDYFLKAHTQQNEFWGQVGDGDSDHLCWERPEDMTTSRTAYKLDQYHPGSDLVAETAAALAASSLAFKPYNSSYSDLLLAHAKQLFSFADRFRGLYEDSIQNAETFYTSSGYYDELLWAATWLFRATDDQYYLKYIVDNAAYMGGTGMSVKEFSWDNKYAGLQILVTKVLLDGKGGAYSSTLKQYQAKANYFACACIQKNDGYNIRKTPGGLMYVREWNNLQYASSAAFLMAVYSDYLYAANSKVTCPEGLVQPQELLNFAKSQADYILGNNPRYTSYLVGYGSKYPLHVHHRGASVSSIHVLRSTVGCVQGYDSWYRRSQSDPNVIYGALVGGPDENDNFYDDRTNYEQSEPTLSGTAPLVGLFAKLEGISTNTGSYQRGPSPVTHQTSSVPHKMPYQKSKVPIELLHSITNSWTIGKTRYYRHKVTVKNTSGKQVTDLKLVIENMYGSLWGLIPTYQKNTYELPRGINVLKPGQVYVFVYVQGGPQAKISVLSYH